ncbi:MAG TPA: hypothetical protein EYP10_02410, partial [Armatimonadetes bacterium]|nr:hypothetical protein [Armatimonadota bacterium]
MVTLQQSVYAHTLGSLSRANSFARALWHVCIYTHLLLTTVIASTFGIAMDAPSGTVYARVITSQ